jgi:hypothetical protein
MNTVARAERRSTTAVNAICARDPISKSVRLISKSIDLVGKFAAAIVSLDAAVVG